MQDNDNTASDAAKPTDERKRFRSEVEFPYSDLEAAVELARTIHDKAGSSCDVDELAAWLGQTASGGTFRTRLGASRLFGLIETAQGRATLTQLGRDILDGPGGAAARVGAFLNVELFRLMYEKYRGNTLPPPAAIERQMGEMGVSPKQVERSRQTFMKSATYANFIDPATGRFVKPGLTQSGKSDPDPDSSKSRKGGGGGGSDDPPDVDPIIAGLLKRLPKAGEVWPEAERKLWLQLLEGSFKLIYKDSTSTP